MRAATKALMIANSRGGNQGGNRGGRSEMEMGGSEMRGGYQGGQNEARNGGYGEMRNGYGRSEMEMGYGRSEMRGGRSEMEMHGYGRSEMRRGGGRSEMEMGGYGGGQSEMRNGYGRSEMEMRRGGGRSEMRGEEMRGEGGQNRIGYEGGGNARSEMEGEMESRRRRDRRGRFRSEMEGEMEGEMGMHYPMPYPFTPPIYEEEMRNPIGFSAEGGGAELHMIRGGASKQEMKLDEETAHEWMKNLQNADGTKGPHWSKEQVKQIMKQNNWDADELEAWVALNAMYSDYFTVARKNNVNNLNFYVDLAKAFMEDKDAKKDKLALYYECIVK